MTTNDDQNSGQLPSKISRRTLAAGAAWSVPVIAVASAAPAYAVSGPCIAPPPDIDGCKYSGSSQPWDKTYRAPITFKNNCGKALTIKITSISWDKGSPFDFRIVKSGSTSCTANYTFPISAGGTYDFYLFWRNTNSAEGTLTFNYQACDSATPPNCTNYTAKSDVHWGPHCGCSAPLPPFARDKDGCSGLTGACGSPCISC